MNEHLSLFDICVVCALYKEAHAVIHEFSARCGVSFTSAFRGPNRQEYRYTVIQNRRGEMLSVCVTWLPQVGPTHTALSLAPLLQEFRPRFVAMSGICAGDRRTVQLGDLIVATAAYHPEEGKIMRGPDGHPLSLPEPKMHGVTPQVLQYVRGFQDWREASRTLPRPLPQDEEEKDVACHLGVMASGMAVRADNPFPLWTERFHRKTIGADMEAAAFYAAVGDVEGLHGLVVKGVSDYADHEKNDVYHEYAARASAVYLLHFMQVFVTQETMPRRERGPSEDHADLQGIWNVPHRRNPHFTGREDLLERLEQHLSTKTGPHASSTRRAALTQPQAIKGLGGIGKTQIAVEYAYRSREQGRYCHIMWVNAISEEALLTSFVELAELLPDDFPAKNETDQQKLVAAIKRWLEQCQQRWLLIFDNADGVSLVSKYLPTQGHGSILLTTRAHAVEALAASIEVNKMGLVEGTHLLLRRARREEQASDEEINEADNIVTALDHFPLALDQAGAYLEETQCSFDEYLDLYQTHRQILLAQRGIQMTNYPDSVATTWSLSFQKVQQAHPAAAELLQLCSFLAPDRIPEELIKDGADYWPESLQKAATNPFSFQQLMADLLKFSLVKRLVEEHTLSIHRLVQAVQIDTIAPKEQRKWAKRVILAVNKVFPCESQDAATWPQCLRFLEQAQICDVLIRQHELGLTEAADLLYRTGKYLFEHALYSLAEPLYQQALRIWEQRLGPQHPEVVFPLTGLATLYREQSKYAEAELLYQRALHILEQSQRSEHLDATSSLNGLAILYSDQGKYAEAEPLLRQALAILEQQLGPEHLRVAFPLTGLANLYSDQGKYAEAELLYQRALCILEQQLDPQHPRVAPSLNNLAILYRERGKYEQAEELYQRALCILEQQLGPEHPQVASPLTGLANIYGEQGKYAEAEPLYQRALGIWEKQWGPEHPDVASPLFNLANIYGEQGKYAEAEPLYQRALGIWEKQWSPEHPDVAYPLLGLANLYKKQGEYAKAEPLYQRALHIWEKQWGPEHPDVAYPLLGLANLYKEQNKYEEAEPLYRRALQIREQQLGPHHLETAESLHDLGVFEQLRGNLRDAIDHFERALFLREKELGRDHSETKQTRQSLQAVRTALDKTVDAAQFVEMQQDKRETEKEHASPEDKTLPF